MMQASLSIPGNRWIMGHIWRFRQIAAMLVALAVGFIAYVEALTDSQDIPTTPPLTGYGLPSFDRIIQGLM